MSDNDLKGGRCTAHSKTTGDQCGQRAILGGTVCHYHGGAAPQVKAKAAQRWSTHLIPAATRRIGELIEDKGFPSTSFAASKFTLENEFGRPVETVLTATVGNMSDDELRAKILALADELRAEPVDAPMGIDAGD